MWRLVPTLSAGVFVVVSACGALAAPSAHDGSVVPVRVVVDNLSQPVHVVPAPSGREGRMFVVEQGGRVRIAEGDRLLQRPFLDLHAVVAHGGLRGLLSLAFHPRCVVNGRAYVYYVGRDGATYVAEIRTVRGFAASRRVLLRIPASREPYAHYGGHVLFGPDGLLYVSIGDGGVPATAQDPDVLLGKVVRLRVGGANAKPEIVASGLRNPWRFSFTRDGSALVIGDVGANRREEIDVVRRRLFGRANLGWPWFEAPFDELNPSQMGEASLSSRSSSTGTLASAATRSSAGSCTGERSFLTSEGATSSVICVAACGACVYQAPEHGALCVQSPSIRWASLRASPRAPSAPSARSCWSVVMAASCLQYPGESTPHRATSSGWPRMPPASSRNCHSRTHCNSSISTPSAVLRSTRRRRCGGSSGT
jgi:Glucose / Sorbosone dehydrogenase